MVVGGPMPGGVVFDGRKSDQTSLDEALGMLQVGKIEAEDVRKLEDTACPSCGSCAFLGTANTMGCVAEALGLGLPGSALAPATYAQRRQLAFESGRAVCELVRQGIRARDILTPPCGWSPALAAPPMRCSTCAPWPTKRSWTWM